MLCQFLGPDLKRLAASNHSWNDCLGRNQLTRKKSNHCETAMLQGSSGSYGEVSFRVRCQGWGSREKERQREHSQAHQGCRHEWRCHLGREPSAPAVSADTTWFRAELPSQALCEFLTCKIKTKQCCFTPLSWGQIFVIQKITRIHITNEPVIIHLFVQTKFSCQPIQGHSSAVMVVDLETTQCSSLEK